MAGMYRVQDDRFVHPIAGESGDYRCYFMPLFFSEPPPIIRIPPTTPQVVRDELLRSFRAYWSDPESAANAIRSALEKLLTAQGVNQTTGRTKAAGKRKFLPLHDRIQRLGATHPGLAQSLMAVKWLGNAGSHSAKITRDDVLDGYEILQYVLDELYVGRSKRIDVLSRAINRRKGPRSRRGRRKA